MGDGPHYDRVRETILRFSPLWIERMGLGHFDIRYAFIEGEYGEANDGDLRITATAETRWNYLMAKIKFYLPSAVRSTDEELEETLVHELCHVLLAPEQALLEIKLETARADLTGEDFDQVGMMMYERMEMATEQAARAILRAWRPSVA